MTRSQLLNLHHYLHDSNIKSITYNGNSIPFVCNTQGLRYCTIDGVKFIEQNPALNTAYGRMAKEGALVTWGIRPGPWDLVIDDAVVRAHSSIGD